MPFYKDIRPEKSSDAASAELKIRDKINQLSSDSDALLVFQQHCKDLLLSSNIRNLFSDNMGVYSSDSLFQQLFKDIKHKILPPLEDKDSINYKITRLFYKKMITDGSLPFQMTYGWNCSHCQVSIMPLCRKISEMYCSVCSRFFRIKLLHSVWTKN